MSRVEPCRCLCHQLRLPLRQQRLLRLLKQKRATLGPLSFVQLGKVADGVDQSVFTAVRATLSNRTVFTEHRFELSHQVVAHLFFHGVGCRYVRADILFSALCLASHV